MEDNIMTHLKVGDKAPDFTMPSHLDSPISLSNLHGKAVAIAFFPLAWTPVCTGQIPSYEMELERFTSLNTQILTVSVDSVPCLKAWAETFGGIHYPILSDFWPHGDMAKKYGVLRQDGRSERAIFIIDDEGIIRYIDVHDIEDQPDNRILFQEIKKLRPGYLDPEPKKVTANLPHGGLVMYCTRWCPECRKARNLFSQYNIKYTEVDVMTVPGADDQVRRWTGGDLVTPTFDIDGEILIDYDEDRLRKLLKIR